MSCDVEESPCSSLGVSEQWLMTVLVPKLTSWSLVHGLNTTLTSLRLVPIDSYTLLYQELKEKYGKTLVKVSILCNI